MFGWLKGDPAKKLEKKIDAKMSRAVEFQRNGKLREYADLMKEIDDMEKELAALKAQKSA